MVLARIILPEEFGLYSLAFIFMTLVMRLKDFGIAGFLIKEKELSEDTLRSAWAILLTGAVVMALFMALSAPYISEFYSEPELLNILLLLSLNVLISPFGIIVHSLLDKQLNFKPTLIVGTIGQVASIAVTLSLASFDFGVYALVFGSLTFTIVEALLLQLYRPKHLPFLPSLSKAREVFHYAKFASAHTVIGLMGHHISELLAGKYFSMHELGLLSRAVSTSTLFNKLFSEAFAPVITPLVANVNHTNGKNFELIRRITKIQLFLSTPFFLIIAFNSKLIVNLLFGSMWVEASTLLTWLCLSRVFFSFTQLIEPVLLGLGKIEICMKASLFLNLTRIGITAVTIQYGIDIMILVTVCIMTPLRLLVFLHIVKEELGIYKLQYLEWAIDPIKYTTLSFSLLFIFPFVLPELTSINAILFGFSALVCTIIYLILVSRSKEGKDAINLFFKSKD